ncbi:hypothetical protein [Pantoea stewartii]|uniref:hypothetical protein n=1 Tax=Pantoea stewartii TaxID=66269 RepID=UPI00197FBA3C|nr:hypothetical protein [Pantoea stewartii]
MKITEREMRGLLTGKCLPGDMRLNEDLPAYLVRKFDELQQKLDAMAADIALNGWVACSPEWIDKNGPCSCEAAPRIAFGNIGPHYHPQSFTSATEAYLNSVRAEGVLMVLRSEFIHFDSDTEDAISHIASQLRSGPHDTADKAD